ncbi:MAG TPA: FkbM family methyltransferase [Candidatus Sulfotelmatobacter sp.]|nr:FkbM family methyltransferase [Candidatus Sulfotelmatobacter sp.]
MSAAYLGLSLLEYPLVLRLRRGEQIHLDELTDLKAFWQIFLRTVYRVRATDEVILDLGANVGVFTLYAARNAPRAQVFAFEPFPSTFRRLVATVRDHHLDPRVTCPNYAAAGASGVRLMPDGQLPSQRRALAAASVTSGTEVMGKTIESMLEENHLPHVDLLKMDIEGSEYEVLLSAPRACWRGSTALPWNTTATALPTRANNSSVISGKPDSRSLPTSVIHKATVLPS